MAPTAKAGGGAIDNKMAALDDRLRSLGRVVVAFSGGADSAFLAWAAIRSLGHRMVLAATAVSPSLAPEELDDCRLLAHEWGMRWCQVATAEMSDPAYEANDMLRCYHCKGHLLDALGPLAGPLSATVVLGVNIDDLGDHRPGQQAAIERGAVFPLVDAGFTKADVREASRRAGLRTWDKPAGACLASRLPYGTPVTLGTLTTVGRAESGLRALGFRQVRVRHYGDLARIEIEVADIPRVVEYREDVIAVVRRAGYRYVTLDLEGFRSGNLNQALVMAGPSPAERQAR
jgi:uncharacterized protein